MKHSTAIRHLAGMVEDAPVLQQRLEMMSKGLRISALWLYGDLLDGRDAWSEEMQSSDVAVAFDVAPQDVWWFARPAELEWATGLVGWQKRPVLCTYRSGRVPVWNHHIERPALLWSADAAEPSALVDALREDSTAAIARLREPAPSADELRQRLADEQAISLQALQATTDAWDEDRWGRRDMRKLGEPMWEAAAGYLDLRQASAALEIGDER